MSTVRIAYLVTHPIQYQAPLLRRLATEPGIELTVFYCSDMSTRRFPDRGFGATIEWDVPLLGGYEHEFLPALGRPGRLSFWRPLNHGLAKRLKAGRFDVLWLHGYWRWYHIIAMATAKRLGLRVFVRDEATSISRARGAARRAAKKVFFRALGTLGDAFLAIGALNREYYLRLGVTEDKVFLVPYVVDNLFFQARAAAAARRREELRAALGLEKGRPIILYVGKMTVRKRPGDLLEAYAELLRVGGALQRPYLLYVGDGCLRCALERRAAQLGLSSVRFLGFRGQAELARYYDLCDVFVLPSVAEPWGLVVNEAMNAARPVVVSDRVGCGADLVRDGENGYVFRAGSVAGLCEVLHRALSSPAELVRMGRRSLEIISGWGIEAAVAGLRQALAAHGAQRRGARLVRGA